jgi:dTDP-4-dehydrorhamnose reductase
VRLLVTGAGGQLGRELVATAVASGHEVRAANRAACDITDLDAVRTTLEEAQPDVLVNCAAWTRVDDAEADRDGAYRANALGARVLAAACAARDVLLMHISTDYVFDGRATTPVDEWQTPNPQTAYGASKLAGEEEIRALAPRHQVVRTSWLYGQTGPNFVLTMLSAARQGAALRVVADQVGTPTWTGHLAPALLRLAARDLPGTFHITNAGAVSWHGFAEAIIAATGSRASISAISTREYPTAAPRPVYSVLDNRLWRLLGEEPLPDWRVALDGYLASLRERGMAGV